jgi:NAD(P)-dependent dehydrogenase (short-subunit alcohol dehydrogenase family)
MSMEMHELARLRDKVAMVDRTVAVFGPVDILVNNAQDFGSAA